MSSQPPLPPTPSTITIPEIKDVLVKFFSGPANTKNLNDNEAVKELLNSLEKAAEGKKEMQQISTPSEVGNQGAETAASPVPPTPERPKEKKENNARLIQEIKLREKIENDFKELKSHCDAIYNMNNELNMEKMKAEQNANAWRENSVQWQEKYENKRKDYNELYKKNQELKDEASQYQSALGDARNYRLSDNDANNPTQLTKVIDDIQDKINEFCKVKGGVELNEQQLTSLLEHYKCKLEPGDKVLLKAALQRHIVETILKKTDEYLNTPQKELSDRLKINKTKEKYLELDLLSSTDEYLKKLNNFIHSRDGTDKVSAEAPKKIRQLVHAVLGDRGFGLSNDKKEHEFIQGLKEEIIKSMNNFRTIKKADKKKENEDMLAEIIREIIKMFYFRIKVLEPPGEYTWIPKDHKIDPTLMETGSLEDDNYDDWVVNLCSFPLISVKSETDRKVLATARIVATKAEAKHKFMNLNLFDSKPNNKRQSVQQLGNQTKI